MSRTSSCSNLNLFTPTANLFDMRALGLCIPVVRHFLRAHTAAQSVFKKDARPMTEFEMKKKVMDVIKWTVGTIVADILPLAFIPFAGVISAILLIAALAFTFFELKAVYKQVDGNIGKIWNVLNAKAPETSATVRRHA